ncbi:hypothetical protein [Labrys monachus]|uniref:Uncharacterized protein n=1 Tax=Labrys monachus TaxID=217067 RepID=A0ABU0FI67_9HYPH|nr:hypothetical protein [Labrys monachus]MDQ0394171.1 hypothetical protein [Labrys monachus]
MSKVSPFEGMKIRRHGSGAFLQEKAAENSLQAETMFVLSGSDRGAGSPALILPILVSRMRQFGAGAVPGPLAWPVERRTISS